MSSFDNVRLVPIKDNYKPQNDNDDIYNQVMALKNSIPDKTTTKEEKEKAIEVKNKIIKLVLQKLEVANKRGDSLEVRELKNQVRILETERDTIKAELKEMTMGTSIYNKEENRDSTKGSKNVSIWTQKE